MKRFDYIIAGAGCAGLSLAYHLSKSSLAGKRILIIDKDPKNSNDRTWSFWTQEPTLFDAIIFRSWNKIRFNGGGYDEVLDLGNYRYNTIRGIDFYQFVKQRLQQLENIHWLTGEVSHIEDGPEEARVVVDEQVYHGQWVFDSLYDDTALVKNKKQYHYLMQHFKGWEIETPYDAFDTNYATMFDFRTPQQNEMRFFYILPFTPRKALVEFTLFTASLLKQEEYTFALKTYIEEVLGINQYSIKEEEQGIIPMYDHPFQRKGGKRIMYIGTKGGINKPSTGYAFLRIQHDSERIVKSLETTGQPFFPPKSNLRFQIYDSMMLQMMYRNGSLSESVFKDLFQKNPIQRLFRFLDEETHVFEDLQVMSTVPPMPFIKAFLKVKLLKKV